MIAILKGDIAASRKLANQDLWLQPLKQLFASWGSTPETWELVWGDFFQVEISKPEEALQKAFEIKALIKKIKSPESQKMMGVIDVRLAIGIGEKSYSANRISESNGSAFIYSGEKFDTLKKENTTIAVKSNWETFDEEINLYLKLAETFMERWTVSSAELVEIVLQNPGITQEEIGKRLGIKQSGVSGRWTRAHGDELLKIERVFRRKLKELLP
ncbi:hypothetical protein J0A67_08600 [Algoriphagus aestuariicola]|jgi:hypothetical protein|uniref:Winged helix-turn-helix transcriptional regulator n=1 Tax=Algoriphagus aestuariicola TaxID=1852016 RepID=A0ABS3BPF3_9BACT|nr:hypothetical protein [Algoriphagus aestuariicola]MBN7800917.1 hypothetical protein [Algoriphagus aestuariicola]